MESDDDDFSLEPRELPGHQLTIQKTFACSSCERTFNDEDQVQEHMDRKHQGEDFIKRMVLLKVE